MSTWAIVPVKGFDHGKSRLMPALAPDDRRALSIALFRRVLRACTGCSAIDHVLVATDSPRALTSLPRTSQLLDPAPSLPFARVLDRALAHAHAHGATRAVIALGDLPLIEPRDIAELVAAFARAPIVVAPDHWRRGVGAIAVTLPAPLPMQLGHRDSFHRTMRAAGERRAQVALVHNPHLSRDLDTGADLRALAAGLGLQSTKPEPAGAWLRRVTGPPRR
jgi:2-phospho-L-lactate guanylyltransferase